MQPFDVRYRDALADPNVRGGLLPFQRAWRATRDAQIASLEQQTGRSFDDLRAELADVKARVIAEWPRWVDEFTERAETAGSKVVRVDTPEQANAHVADICKEVGAQFVVKGKSMVSEEIRLNDHLRSLGIAAVETDLGEWLLQLAGEHPSHLVMPAIHKRKEQIADLLTRMLRREFLPEDITGMVRSVRVELRDRFLNAAVGLSGANALIAESGSVMLVCNEGNNRMAVALPPVHIVTAGPEKIVPTFADAMLQVRLLARSATGQPITTYTNFLTGPRPGGQQHIVLIDNGRSAMAADPDFRSALGCIRCGACANVCPPYAVVGGHAFGHIYTGAIGLVNTPFHHRLEDGAGPQSLCVSCGACVSVCPVEIPLADQILEVRHRVAEELGLPWPRRLALRALASRRLVGAAARAAALVMGPFRRDGVSDLPGPQRHTSWRTLPAIPLVPARTRIRDRPSLPRLGDTTVSGKRVLLFLQCLADRLLPSAAVAAVGLLEAAGAEVMVPRRQHCCGLPAYDSGAWGSARRMAHTTIEALEGVDDVVTVGSSCVVTMTHDYPRLLRDDPVWTRRAEHLAGRVHDLVDYLAGPARLPDGALDSGDRTPVTVHRFCQSQHMLGLRDEMESLLRDVCRVPVRSLPENDVCCGFGGFTSIAAPDVAAGILERKLACVDETAAPILITNNPGCALHLKGAAHASGRPVRVVQFAEYLGGRLERLAGIHR